MYPEELIILKNKEEEIFDMSPEYPYIIREVDAFSGKTLIAPWHWHEHLEFVYLKQGSLTYDIAQQQVHVDAGSGIFINSNILHQVHSSLPAMAVSYEVHMLRRNFLAEDNSLFDKKYIRPLIQSNFAPFISLNESDPVQKLILDYLLQISILHKNKPFAYELKARNIMTQIWMELLILKESQTVLSTSAAVYKEERLKGMLLFMQENFMDNLSLKDISDSTNISERECLRCFQEVFHMTPFEYLLEYRIQASCHMLKNTSEKIVDIATKCGFNSSSYFGKVFKRHMNCTPHEYRCTQS